MKFKSFNFVSQRIVGVVTMLLLSAACFSTHAASAKSITLIVPFKPGGDTDVTARVFAPFLAKHLGVSVNVVNKFREDGKPDISYISSAPKDGSVFLVGSSTSISLPRAIKQNEETGWENLNYVNIITTQPLLCVTGKNSTLNSFKDLIGKVKAEPSSIRHVATNYTSTLYPAYFLKMAGLRYDQIRVLFSEKPIRSIEMVEDGRADFMCATSLLLLPFIKEGRLRPLFSNSLKPIYNFPEIDTAKQIGLRNIERFLVWTALAAPQNTPDSALAKIRAALKKLATDPEWNQTDMMKYGSNGITLIKDANQFVREEVNFYSNLAIVSGVAK